MELGFNITNEPTKCAADIALAASLGATWVRTSQEQSWGAPSTRLGPYRKACDDHGLKLWNTDQSNGHKVVTAQKDLDAWGNNVAEYAAIADCTGMGNEDNGYGSNDKIPNPKARAQMALAAIEWRDKLSPGRKLATPELCPAAGNLNSTYIEPLLFFTNFINADPTILDAKALWIGWHGYCDGRYPASTNATWNTCHRMRDLDVFLKSKGKHKIICSTEWGAQTGPSSWAQKVTPQVQAQRFNDYIQEYKSQEATGIKHGPMIWYQLRDTSPSDWTTFAGMVDIHGNPKPVAAQFTAAAKAL